MARNALFLCSIRCWVEGVGRPLVTGVREVRHVSHPAASQPSSCSTPPIPVGSSAPCPRQRQPVVPVAEHTQVPLDFSAHRFRARRMPLLQERREVRHVRRAKYV
jgi:hypothetical protein